MAMTLAEAERILQAAKKKAQDMGVKVAISIVDPRGDPVAMVRLDGALWRTAPVSREMILNYVAEHSLGLPKSY